MFQINHGQYELVFTQVLDGELINHHNEPIPDVNPRIKREFEPKSNLAYKELDGESTRREQFKKEQLEFEKKEREQSYKDSLNVLKQLEMIIETKVPIYNKVLIA